MKRLDKAKEDKLLIDIVRILAREFPDASVTSDLDFFPLDNKDMCITVIGVSEDEAIKAIQKVIPEYNLEDAAADKFTVFIYFYEEFPEPHNLREVLL